MPFKPIDTRWDYFPLSDWKREKPSSFCKWKPTSPLDCLNDVLIESLQDLLNFDEALYPIKIPDLTLDFRGHAR